jgi:hypothetical protein
MTLANVKGMAIKGMLAAVAAGAFLMVAPAKAEAQNFGVDVRFGHPAPAPFYGRPGYYGFERHEDFVRHEEAVRHEEFVRREELERAHRFHDGYRYR